ncbi:MAG: diphthine--ammonia ligase [Candidatus Omnitrophica bacterium]|nr:diphthine--ammonia ligase [Candidatus Omnitrophota bacterium]
MKAFVSWSSGKESCMSLFRIQKAFDVKYLFNMVSEDGRHSRSHGVDKKLIQMQAEALGIPLIQQSSTWQSYEDVFKTAIIKLKEEGISAGIFGDIDMQQHRDWVENVCADTGINPILPLWQEEREKLVREFIDAGFKAVVVVVNEKYMGKEWLGRTIDESFIADLKSLPEVDIAGEKGEYHTFVFDGPNFKKPVEFYEKQKIYNDGYWFLDLKA